MSSVDDLSSDQKQAYDLIRTEGSLLQSKLWKKLNADSRKGSRLAKSLAENGLIEREETVSNGRTTYLLKPVNGESATTTWEGNETPETSEDETDDDLKPREERALTLIQDRRGMYQSEFWKELDVSSRTGSRIASSLEEQGLIRREETTYNGQRTYFLQPAKKDLDFSLLMAGNEMAPLVGANGNVDPVDSNEFSQWVLQLMHEGR